MNNKFTKKTQNGPLTQYNWKISLIRNLILELSNWLIEQLHYNIFSLHFNCYYSNWFKKIHTKPSGGPGFTHWHWAAQLLYYMLLNMDFSGSLASLMTPVIIVILPSVGWSVYCSSCDEGGAKLARLGQAAGMEACEFQQSSQFGCNLISLIFSLFFSFSPPCSSLPIHLEAEKKSRHRVFRGGKRRACPFPLEG